MDTEYQPFDVKAYLNERYPRNITDQRVHIHWRLTTIHNFYKRFHTEWDNSTASLLECGAGPSIHTLISAAPYVGQIYHSDYLQQCRNEALLWKYKDPEAYDWSPYFQFIVNTLEGQRGMDAVIKRQELLRSKFKDSLFINLKSNDPLPGHTGLFDIIYAGFCIETAASSLEEYYTIIKRLFDLLNPNGYLIMLLSLGCSWYFVNGIKYPNCPVYTEDGLIALKEAGFTLHYVESIKKKYEKGVTYYNNKKYNCVYIAQKNNNN